MRFKILVPILAFILLAAPASKAQQLPRSISDWSNVKAVPPGDKLIVKLKDGKTLKGQLINVSDTTLTLYHNKKATELAQWSIFRVHRIVANSRGTKALMGFGIGAGIGAGIGLAIGAGHDFNISDTMPGFAIIGAGIGTLVGLVTGGHKKFLIYEAK